MAYDYMNQAMGFGPQAFETEEERRKREEEEASREVRTKTIKTFADGTQEQTVKTQIPGPVAPDSTYGRMVQAESGGQNFDAQGRPLTSPKGAMFASQVLPSTAQNPGFGIRPAQAQTPEEYNRVGQEYYQALLKKYNGDEQRAAAAYNMGPGAVDRNIAQNQGQFNISQAPKETQGYLNRVLNAVVPSAQAAPVAPQQPAVPGTQVTPGQYVNLANSQGPRVPYQQPGPVAPGQEPTVIKPVVTPQTMTDDEGNTLTIDATGQRRVTNAQGQDITATGMDTTQINKFMTGDIAERFTNAKTNADLQRIGLDANVPQWAQKLANQKAYEQMRMADEKEKTQKEITEKVVSGDSLGLARMLQGKRGEGSWAKAILLGYLGAPQMAAAELGKMGYGATFQKGKLGNDDVMLEMRFDGLPIQGYNTRTGVKLTDNELAQAAGNMMAGKVTTSGTYFQTKDGQILRAQSDEKGNTRLVDSASGQVYTGSTVGLVKLEEAGALRKMDYGLVTDLKKKHGTNVLEAEKEYVGLNGPFKSPEERAQFRSAYGFEAGMPGAVAGAGAPTAGGAGTPSAGGAVAPTTGGTGRVGTGIEVQKQELEAQKKIKEQQARNSYQARQIAPFVGQIKELIPKTTSSGLGSRVDELAGFFGASPEGADAIAAIAPLADKILKSVERFEGPQSDLDVKSYKEAAGRLSDPKVPVDQKKAAFATILEILQRNAPDVNWKEAMMTKEDKAALKWANSNPNDPRAKEIKKRFE